MDEAIKYKKILSIIAGTALILAIPPIWPYGYFILLRWVVTGVAIFNGYVAYKLEKSPWVWTMGAVAVLFNPIAPIFLGKEVWVVIDVVVAFVMFYSVKKLRP